MKARELAHGRWREVLVALGVDEGLLDGHHHACPACGGVDRFRFADRNGSGNYFCSDSDGRKGGIDLLMHLRGVGYVEACREIERVAGTVQPLTPKAKADPRIALHRIASLCRPAGFCVTRYLRERGLAAVSALREARLLYWHEGARLGPFATMVAVIHGATGEPESLHLTYLDGIAKANVPSPRKVMTPLHTITGGAIRLFPAAETMGVAEGIETALSAAQLFNVPVWAAVSAGGVESFVPPIECQRLTIFADHDESFTGQAAAYALAKRMQRQGLSCDVVLPELGDWNEELVLNGRKRA